MAKLQNNFNRGFELNYIIKLPTSNYTFHIMRDHPAHGTAMLGGMWGMRLTHGAARPPFTQLFHNMLTHGNMWSRGLDQGFNSIDLNVCYIATLSK